MIFLFFLTVKEPSPETNPANQYRYSIFPYDMRTRRLSRGIGVMLRKAVNLSDKNPPID
jgi:hypothetical protein